MSDEQSECLPLAILINVDNPISIPMYLMQASFCLAHNSL